MGDFGLYDTFDESGSACYCIVCGGECFHLGTLGKREHFRCRNCGMDQSGARSDEFGEETREGEPVSGSNWDDR